MTISDDVARKLRRHALVSAAEKLAESQVFAEEMADYFVDEVVPKLRKLPPRNQT